MLIEEGDCVDEYNLRLESKMDLLIQRLFRVNNIKLIMIDEKIKIEKNNKKTLDEKEILLNNSSKIRGLVNYNKLNYILTENSLNISNSKSNIRDVATLPNIKQPEKITSLSESLQYQFNNFSNEELKRNSPRKRKKENTNKSRNNLFMLLSNNLRSNSSNAKKISKIKLYKKKQSILNHKVLEELFITPPKNNNNSNSLINKYRNNSSKKKKSLNDIINIETDIDKSHNHNHPYYEPKMLIKRNKYKIFENIFNNKKTQVENMKKNIIRLKQLQNIHSPIKKHNKINDNDDLINFLI